MISSTKKILIFKIIGANTNHQDQDTLPTILAITNINVRASRKPILNNLNVMSSILIYCLFIAANNTIFI